MLNYIYMALRSFRGVFSRHSSWLVFSMVVLGFIGATEIVGVTSFCRFWGLGESAYHTFLHFFRCEAWCLAALVGQWSTFVLAQNETVIVEGRAVLLGDHTYVPKDGRRMPGVVTLHQDSETQSKPSYFRGHCLGALSLLVGSLGAPFGLPLALSIHQGLIHIGQENKGKGNVETLGTRIVQMALDFTIRHNLASVLILDAFFPGAAVFNLAHSLWSIELKQPLLTLIIRAKKNCVAYFEAEKHEQKKPGRSLKYGVKVTLMELFDHIHLFSKMQCTVYGKVEDVSIMTINLLWKPTCRMIRFVLAVTSRGPIVLMCSDLNQNPVIAIELYCVRTRVEIMFDMLKNLIGAFKYRFWSKLMPCHSRKPKKNKDLKKPATQALQTVLNCWDAYERFVMLGAISLGLLEMIALKYSNSIWNCYDGYLRTRSRELPSERTVKYVIARLILKDLLTSAPRAIMREIRERYFGQKFPSQRSSPVTESQNTTATGL
jgi:hypothetical protein